MECKKLVEMQSKSLCGQTQSLFLESEKQVYCPFKSDIICPIELQ